MKRGGKDGGWEGGCKMKQKKGVRLEWKMNQEKKGRRHRWKEKVKLVSMLSYYPHPLKKYTG